MRIDTDGEVKIEMDHIDRANEPILSLDANVKKGMFHTERPKQQTSLR